MVEGSLAAFAELVDLASSALGGRALLASDDFFAPKERLVEAAEPVPSPDAYTDRGKWMDGWESRRKRVPGHDWCIVELGARGRIAGVDIDTRHFLGNHPPFASLEACDASPGTTSAWLVDEAAWTEVLEPVPLRAGAHNLFALRSGGPFSHVRLRIYPDGGVARLRVFGEAAPGSAAAGEPVDLAGVLAGGRALAASDMFFSPMANLLLPGRPANMGAGWETRRRRAPGEEWIVVALGAAGVLERIEIDTALFKGNHPSRAALDGVCWPGAPVTGLVAVGASELDPSPWEPIVGDVRLGPDAAHVITSRELGAAGPLTHLRLRIAPCGGVARLRAFGRPTDPFAALPARAAGLARLNALDVADALEALGRACGARRWIAAMLAARPFASRAALMGAAEHAWWRLGPSDWREAFACHPRIGASVAELGAKYGATTGWSASEQAGAAGASDEVLAALARGNAEYAERFGHTFIVCATGRSAVEMLAALEERLGARPEDELAVAAGEQAKITRLRLDKLLSAS